jgi:GDP-L-fucose synthase
VRKLAAQLGNEQVETVFMAAGRVGGIKRNIDEPAQMLADNLQIALNVTEMCHSIHAKLVYLGSSCIYPRDCPQPMREEYLLSGPLEPTNEPYAIAKIVGIKLCEAYARQYGMKYLALMPCNLYGPHDHFDGEGGHMVPMLINRFVEAAESVPQIDVTEYQDPHKRTIPSLLDRGTVTVWGTGTPRREIMHVDDFAAAALHLVDRSATGLINVGTGVDFSIAEIAKMIAEAAGYCGDVIFDSTKPDGMPRKVMDVTRLNCDYGWRPAYAPPMVPMWAENQCTRGRLAQTVQWYRENRR